MGNYNEDGSTRQSTFNKAFPSDGQAVAHVDNTALIPITEQDPFYSTFWDHVLATSTIVRQGEDPVRILYEIDDLITYRGYSNYSRQKAEFADRSAPLQEYIKNVKNCLRNNSLPSLHDWPTF